MNQDTYPGDGSNLSGLQPQTSVWIDERGIHLAFWDVPLGTKEPLDLSLKDARYIITFDPHGLHKMVASLLDGIHAIMDFETPWQRAVGAPAPFPPDFRYAAAGIPRLGANDPDRSFKNPEGFDPEAWNRKLETD